ncbi:protein of unknown function [Mariniphaga anaerophila]|uniref:DUF4252 domain-containing protein n=1 Tax=Mariniphaga anaerophila TaxID=1484053 RepID=A0A1M5CGJ9_9BACT|nr:DUF4252 domain-containing protein [Mariniphaga anaerophila]SHF53894.1 protein of unknown function [Mariniphaga anaerophila]
MKTIVLVLTIFACSLGGWAQQSLFDELTEKYADKDGFSASQITSDMFDLYIKKRNIDERSPVFNALKNLDEILVVSQTGVFKSGISKTLVNEEDGVNGEIRRTILDYYKKNNFLLFKTEKQMGEDLKVFLKKKQDKIESLALVTHSHAVTNLVQLQGDIDLSTVSQLSQALNLRGLENLDKIYNQRPSAFYVGSSRVNLSDQEHVEEMITHRQQFLESQHNLSEERIRMMEESQQNLIEMQQEMQLKYGRQAIFLTSPGNGKTLYYINGKKSGADAVKNISPDKIESIEIFKAKEEGQQNTVKIKTK